MPDALLITLSIAINAAFWALVYMLVRRADARETARLRALAQQRPDETRERFVQFFESRNVDPGVVDSVYSYFQELVAGYGVRDFPVLPSDRICEVYPIEPDDLDDDIVKLARKARLKLPRRGQSTVAVVTVEDLVLFLAACSNRSPAKPAPH